MFSQFSMEFDEEECNSSVISWIEQNCRDFEDWPKAKKVRATRDRPTKKDLWTTKWGLMLQHPDINNLDLMVVIIS